MKKIALLGAVALLSACSSNKVVETAMTVPPNSIVDTQTYVYKAKVVEEQIEVMPDWFKKMPESETAIYSTGTSATTDLQLSIDLAILNAKTTLADRINGRVRSQTKSFVVLFKIIITNRSKLRGISKKRIICCCCEQFCEYLT